MKVYTVIARYNGYDEYPDKYIGTFDSLETVIEQHGMDLDYIIESWGSVVGYISWLNNFNGHVCYTMAGENLEWGYQLHVYETELISKLEHKFI